MGKRLLLLLVILGCGIVPGPGELRVKNLIRSVRVGQPEPRVLEALGPPLRSEPAPFSENLPYMPGCTACEEQTDCRLRTATRRSRYEWRVGGAPSCSDTRTVDIHTLDVYYDAAGTVTCTHSWSGIELSGIVT